MAKRIIVKEGCRYRHYDDLKESYFAGYANYYIEQKWDLSSLKNKAQLDVYKCLFRIDEELGSKPEFQLWGCIMEAVSLNIIEVINNN